MKHIYLDANATTPLDETVRQAMVEALQANYLNPASQHQPGQRARSKLEVFRSEIASWLGAAAKDRLIFTSGGTESNNLALIGLAGGLSPRQAEIPAEIIISAIEHPSVLGAADFLKSQGFLVKYLPVNRQGLVQIDALRDLIGPQTRLLSLMGTNNETGVIQDVPRAVAICQDYGIPVHSDAVQLVGKLPFHFQDSGLAAVTLTAHKINGPRGIGGLLVADGITLHPTIFGGTQQLGLRPGTEDVALAAGFAKAVQLAISQLDDQVAHMHRLRQLFESGMRSELPETVIHGETLPRAPHTSNLGFPGYHDYDTVNRQALLMAADMAGVAISTGSACTSGSSEPSHVLVAMGCPPEIVESSIRVSFGRHSQEPEVLEACRRIINAVKHLRRKKSGRI